VSDERKGSAERGFTILEALISLAVFVALLAAILSTYAPARAMYRGGVRIADVQQNARLAMAEMAREIRSAGYFPENFATTPADPPLADPIRVATDDSIAIYGAVDGTTVSKVFFFCIDGTTLRRASGTVGAASSYTCTSGEVMAEEATSLRFTYYDADGNPIPSPPSTPYELDSVGGGSVASVADVTQRSQIRRVVITLTTETELPGARGTRSYTLTSDVSLRNSL
jgi:Tfp pilus assembly protein PilW